MNKLRTTSALLLTAVLSLTQAGCKKALDLDPLDSLSDASYWKTPNDFMLAANAFYLYERTYADAIYDVSTYAASYYNVTLPTGTVLQSYHADQKSDIVGGQNAYSRGLNSVLTNDASYLIDYTRVRAVNYLLARASTYTTPNDIKKYVAEAKFFRAYVYFDLLQLYGGVPIIDKLLDTNAAELQAPQNTRDQVADFIIADLNAAIPDLPNKTAQTADELGRVNKETAQAFLGRVALYEGTWQKFRGNTSRGTALLDVSATASNAVITGAQYQLFAPAILGDSAQKYMFLLETQKSNPASLTKTANNEYILANRYDFTTRQARVNVSRQANGINPTMNFVNLYLCKDGLPINKSPLFQGYATLGSEFINRDNRMRYNLKRAGGYYWFGVNNPRVDWTGGPADRATAYASPFVPYANSATGYANQKWITERVAADNEESYDYPVIRYAEVLLNYAEATFEKNGNISDADLDKSLNLVRNRVNKTMPKLSNALVGTNGLDMQTEIRRERTIELYLEGFRFDDLKRWHDLTTLNTPLRGIRWTGTEYQTKWPAQSVTAKDALGNLLIDNNRSFTEKNFLLPLPTVQIQLNPQLQQNPGW